MTILIVLSYYAIKANNIPTVYACEDMYLQYIRPLFVDFMFFISALMYFYCRTYFSVTKDLAIISSDQPNIENGKFLKITEQ